MQIYGILFEINIMRKLMLTLPYQPSSLYTIPELAGCANETLWKSIWYTFFSGKRYSDIYIAYSKSFKDQCMSMLHAIHLYFFGNMDPSDYAKQLLHFGCEKYIDGKPELYKLISQVNRTDLFRRLFASCNLELIKNFLREIQ